MSGEFYSEDDFRPQSPPLERVFVRAAPSPSPPPVVTQVFHPPVSSLSSRRRKKANRRKTRPTQGDLVLIREMDPNRPDIAQQVSQHALNSDSDSAPEDDEEDMDDQPASNVALPPNHPTRSGAQPFSMQQPGKDTLDLPLQPAATVQHRDSVLEADIKSGAVVTDRRPSDEAVIDTLQNGSQRKGIDASRSTPIITSTLPSTTTSPGRDQRNGSISGISSHDESLATGTLRQLTIPPSRALATDTLPALQPQSPPRDVASPNTQLPSISHMVGDLPRSASISEEGSRSNGFPHRQSVSSLGQSPTFRQLSISSHAHSPGTPFPPLSASSPISAASSVQRDPFLQSGGHIFGANRRPSQVSDSGRYPPNLQSGGSPSEGYQSSDGPSPGSQQTPIEGRPRHMSLDGALASNSATRILPPPIGSAIQHIPMHGSGSFRCDYPGCNAAPFQTQYLLNSHTNVHSQNRPHYCPVEGCPRSEGGKGFKRKNEMIRHGLVHQSPGYVCPFCPDREHKYPRPDNLQRHVRVHHVDKDKDDPELREVLAQRPEGGSRGRRRRVSGV